MRIEKLVAEFREEIGDEYPLPESNITLIQLVGSIGVLCDVLTEEPCTSELVNMLLSGRRKWERKIAVGKVQFVLAILAQQLGLSLADSLELVLAETRMAHEEEKNARSKIETR